MWGECTAALYNRLAREKVAKREAEEEEEKRSCGKETEPHTRGEEKLETKIFRDEVFSNDY